MGSFYLYSEYHYFIFIEQTFSPCIELFAKITTEDVLLLDINSTLLQYSKHDQVIIRLGAVYTLIKLFSNLGIRYLCCLSEIIFSLNDLIKNSDERMEILTNQLINIIEQFTQEKKKNDSD